MSSFSSLVNLNCARLDFLFENSFLKLGSHIVMIQLCLCQQTKGFLVFTDGLRRMSGTDILF